MSRRGVTLKGEAAGAFINAMLGKEPKNDNDKYMRIATFVHMEMKAGNEDKAKLIVKSVAERGIDVTLAQMEGRTLTKPVGVPNAPAPRTDAELKELLAARREVVTRAVMFELACEASKTDNSITAEDAMNRACEALGNATRRLLRIQRRKV